jgi:hypothetical protein
MLIWVHATIFILSVIGLFNEAFNSSVFFIIIIIIIIWFVRLLALRPLLAYCASLV